MAKAKQTVKEEKSRSAAPQPQPAPGPRPVPRLLERYRRQAIPALMARFGYDNTWQVPRLEKIVINVGLGEALTDAKALDNAARDIATLSGQRPVVTRAKSSIASFKLREGNPIGIVTTLRGERMYAFLDRLVNLALPRVRDFRGVSPDSFDGRGNYSLGLSEQLMWPEIQYDSIDKVRGLELTIVTTARSDDAGRELLRLLGMPFRRA